MKVVLVSTYESQGGAAIACKRLEKALLAAGIDTKMVVQEKSSSDSNVISVSDNRLKKVYSFGRFVFERLRFMMAEKSKDVRFAFSLANTGYDITQLKEIHDADIIHLHWINQGFISLRTISKLLSLNKPVVWTLHDMWAFTGGCHYSRGCLAYETECKCCPYLEKPTEHDLSNKVWKRKKAQSKYNDITYVTCSQWLKTTAEKSALLKSAHIEAIPNPIDAKIFKPYDKTEARNRWQLPVDKKIILFGAMKVHDTRKGFSYLQKALALLRERNPALIQEADLVVFGSLKGEGEVLIPGYKIHFLGSIHSAEDMVKAYSAADVFVLPSLEDNLPNTLMEAMACGTPTAGFDIGGIPEMIDHQQTGYLAQAGSAEDLAKGIDFILHTSTPLSRNAIKKALDLYDERIISQKYIELYQDLLKKQG